MEKGTHGQQEQSFDELDYIGQARSLNGTIQTLRKELRAHIEKGNSEKRNTQEVKSKYTAQLQGIINEIL